MRNFRSSRIFVALISTLSIALFVVSACQFPSTQTAEPNAAIEPTAEAAAEEAVEAETAAEPTEAAVEEAASESADSTNSTQTFTIVQEGTEARFKINEILRGEEFEVVGVTSMVTGEIIINPADPAQTQLGLIQIDARDLTTDTRRRNTALRRFILRSALDANRYITFTPIAIEGLPDSVEVGETFDFQVTGELKIRDTTKAETFDISVTANSESEISGFGSTTILYSDYGIRIPSVPFVASVEDEVRLEIDFRAVASN